MAPRNKRHIAKKKAKANAKAIHPMFGITEATAPKLESTSTSAATTTAMGPPPKPPGYALVDPEHAVMTLDPTTPLRKSLPPPVEGQDWRDALAEIPTPPRDQGQSAPDPSKAPLAPTSEVWALSEQTQEAIDRITARATQAQNVPGGSKKCQTATRPLPPLPPTMGLFPMPPQNTRPVIRLPASTIRVAPPAKPLEDKLEPIRIYVGPKNVQLERLGPDEPSGELRDEIRSACFDALVTKENAVAILQHVELLNKKPGWEGLDVEALGRKLLAVAGGGGAAAWGGIPVEGGKVPTSPENTMCGDGEPAGDETVDEIVEDCESEDYDMADIESAGDGKGYDAEGDDMADHEAEDCDAKEYESAVDDAAEETADKSRAPMAVIKQSNPATTHLQGGVDIGGQTIAVQEPHAVSFQPFYDLDALLRLWKAVEAAKALSDALVSPTQTPLPPSHPTNTPMQYFEPRPALAASPDSAAGFPIHILFKAAFHRASSTSTAVPAIFEFHRGKQYAAKLVALGREVSLWMMTGGKLMGRTHDSTGIEDTEGKLKWVEMKKSMTQLPVSDGAAWSGFVGFMRDLLEWELAVKLEEGQGVGVEVVEMEGGGL